MGLFTGVGRHAFSTVGYGGSGGVVWSSSSREPQKQNWSYLYRSARLARYTNPIIIRRRFTWVYCGFPREFHKDPTRSRGNLWGPSGSPIKSRYTTVYRGTSWDKRNKDILVPGIKVIFFSSFPQGAARYCRWITPTMSGHGAGAGVGTEPGHDIEYVVGLSECGIRTRPGARYEGGGRQSPR